MPLGKMTAETFAMQQLKHSTRLACAVVFVGLLFVEILHAQTTPAAEQVPPGIR